MKKKIKKIIPDFQIGDCLPILTNMKKNYADFVLTDPPYFLDRLDDEWNNQEIAQAKSKNGIIGGKLPDGMKFDPKQGIRLQEFIEPVAQQIFRILKPGGYFLMFASPRLYHRAAIAVENVGFEIRDCYAWRYTKKAQYKAFSMNHFIRKRKSLTEKQKISMIKKLRGRKTPQLRPQFEPIMCAQKPREGTFIDNWLKYETGLIAGDECLENGVPQTVMTVEKEPRCSDNIHVTPKPIALCEHLIRLFSLERQIVLDPFVGSGSTCLAAYNTGRRSVGIDINPEHIEVAYKRLENFK